MSSFRKSLTDLKPTDLALINKRSKKYPPTEQDKMAVQSIPSLFERVSEGTLSVGHTCPTKAL